MKKATAIPMALAMAVFAGCVTTVGPSHETIVAAMGEPTESATTSMGVFSLAAERGFAFSCEVSLADGVLVAKGDDGHRAEGSACAAAPLLDVLKLASPGRKLALVLEIDVPVVPLLKSALSDCPSADSGTVVLESADMKVCAAVKDIMPEYEVYLLCAAVTADTLVSAARSAKADGVDVAFDGYIVDEAFVKLVKEAGLKLRVNAVEELPQLLRAFGVGADAVSVRGAKRLYDEYCALYAPEQESRDAFSDRIIDGAAFPTGI